MKKHIHISNIKFPVNKSGTLFRVKKTIPVDIGDLIDGNVRGRYIIGFVSNIKTDGNYHIIEICKKDRDYYWEWVKS